MSASLFALILGSLGPQEEGRVESGKPMDPRIFCHARVERFVEVPQCPGRLQIHGVFMIATRDEKGKITGFDAPQRGHLDLLMPYPPLAKSDEVYRQIRATLAGVAGKGSCIGLRKHSADYRIRFRKAGERELDPDPCVYQVFEVKEEAKASFEAAAPLRALPVPASPTGAREVEPGVVTLVAQVRPSGKAVAFGFEIRSDAGEREEGRAEIPRNGSHLKWTPKLVLKAGARGQWRVWEITAEGNGTAVETEFSVKKAPGE